MLNSVRIILLFSFAFSVAVHFKSFSQSEKKTNRKHEIYFSWGYNTEWFTRSTLYISQPSLGNDYAFENISGHDRPGWDENLFEKDISIPQYNYRLGYFFNEKKGLAVEINFDHTKFIFADDQYVHIKGTLYNRNVDSTIYFSESNGFYYYLNNGANFLLFNIVKRWNWISNKQGSIKIDAMAKAGIGPVIPHVQNSFFGNANISHFQFGGWNIGVEGDLRITFFNHIYLEYANKLDYASYSHLRIYEGTAKHAFGTYEMIMNLGVTFPVGKKAAAD